MIGAGLKKPAEDVSGKITRTILNKYKIQVDKIILPCVEDSF